MRRLFGVAGVLLVLAGIGTALFLVGRPTARIVVAPAPAASADAPASAPVPVAVPTQPVERDPSALQGQSSVAHDLKMSRAREAKWEAENAVERRKKQHLCPAFALPGFPWPDAPLPTSSTQIARAYLAAPGEPEPATLGDVRKRLDRMVQAAGYRLPSILGAGCNGFAMVLDLERLRDDGRRVDGVDGFAGPGQRKSFSVLDIMIDLIKAEPGFFRIIVIVVTDEARVASTARASADQLRTLADAGKAALPGPLEAKAVDERYAIEALVYEFEKYPKMETADLRKPEGRLAATTHLAQARLIDLKGRAR